MTKRLAVMSWRSWMFAITIIFIPFTAIYPYIHDGFLKWNILAKLNLGAEMNLAAWWSGGLLFLSGCVAYQIATGDIVCRRAWMIIALIFSLLSFDEMGSIHERVGNLDTGLTIYILMALLGGSSLMLAIWILWRNNRDKHGLAVLLVGVALLASAAPNEYIEHRIDWPYYLIGPRIAFEEGLEIVGGYICFLTMTKFRAATGFPGWNTRASLIRTKKVLLAGFAFHIVVAWVAVRYIEIGFRGNPAIWYFMAVFLWLSLLFLINFKARSNRFLPGLAGLYFLALSVSSLHFLAPNPGGKLYNLGLIGDPHSILASQWFLIFLLYLLLMRNSTRTALLPFAFVPIALGVSWWVGDQFIKYVASGFFALMTGLLFLQMEWISDDKSTVLGSAQGVPDHQQA